MLCQGDIACEGIALLLSICRRLDKAPENIYLKALEIRGAKFLKKESNIDRWDNILQPRFPGRISHFWAQAEWHLALPLLAELMVVSGLEKSK